jgi:hypothetical protein
MDVRAALSPSTSLWAAPNGGPCERAVGANVNQLLQGLDIMAQSECSSYLPRNCLLGAPAALSLKSVGKSAGTFANYEVQPLKWTNLRAR